MRRPSRALVPSAGVGAALGLALIGAGTFLVWDAFEGRGRPRPWPLRLVTVV